MTRNLQPLAGPSGHEKNMERIPESSLSLSFKRNDRRAASDNEKSVDACRLASILVKTLLRCKIINTHKNQNKIIFKLQPTYLSMWYEKHCLLNIAIKITTNYKKDIDVLEKVSELSKPLTKIFWHFSANERIKGKRDDEGCSIMLLGLFPKSTIDFGEFSFEEYVERILSYIVLQVLIWCCNKKETNLPFTLILWFNW